MTDYLALAIALAAIALVLVYTLRTGAPPMPSGRKVRAAALDMLAGERPARIADLGAGWGGLAVSMAERWPEADVTAYELSPLPYWWMQVRKAISGGPSNLALRREDFLKADLDDHDCVVCFLNRDVMTRLAEKIRRDHPHVALLGIYFELPGFKPVAARQCDDIHRTSLFLYRIGREGEETERDATGPSHTG